MKKFTTLQSLGASLLLLLSSFAHAETTELAPSVQFTTGLTGSQSRLSWSAIPGARYRIHSSTDLSDSGGAGAWKERAVVAASTTDGIWVDPEPAGNRAFYRIDPPVAEVFSVSPAVISPGGTLIIKAQCLPDGCSIVFDFGGTPPVLISARLVPDGPGQYRAVVLDAVDSGEKWCKIARIVDGLGATVAMIGQTFEATQSGFASDGPSVLPPAHPLASLKTRTKSNQTNELSARGKGNREARPPSLSDVSVSHRITGEVCEQACDLSVAVPAGPALDLVRTYRSLQHGGTAARWEHCFAVRIEPMPLGSGVDATCIQLFTGDGRRDVLLRQADGSFSADGMFRTGVFKPDTSFELTFADQSKFIFCPLVGAPWRGRIGSIEDRNGVALTCTYSTAGKLISVSSQFGQSLSFDYDTAGQLGTVTDHTGRFVSYTYFAAGETGGNPGDLKSASCPQLPGQAAIQGPTTFTYSTGFTDSRRNSQLLTERDGAGRLVCAYAYSSSTNDTDADFARCVSVDRHRVLPTDAPMTFSYAFLPPTAGFAGGLRCFSCDEVGRVTECDFDKQWRCVRLAELTGFATPGVPVTATSNRPPAASKRRSSDPDMYVTTCDYNADHCCTVCTAEDGLQTLTTYARDLSRNCPVLERGNARVTTLRSPFGEERTVSCDFLPGFGTGESSGYSCSPDLTHVRIVKQGKGIEWPELKASDGKKHFEVTARLSNHGIPGKPAAAGGRKHISNVKWSARSDAAQRHVGAKAKSWMVNNFEVQPVFGLKTEWITSIGLPKVTPKIAKESHGRSASSGAKPIFGLKTEWITSIGLPKITPKIAKESHGKFRTASTGGITAMDDWETPVVRMTTSLGQVFTWGYDEHGNCTSRTAPVGGGTCIRNPFGQITRLSVNNGTTPLITDVTYDPDTKFCTSVIQDPTGLALTVSCDRNALGLITRVVDERGNDTLISYNACDQPISVSSPPVGTDALSAARITCTQFYDASGLPVRYDLEHRDAAGGLVAANPVYSSFCMYDHRGRLIGEACEQKPVDFPLATLAPAPSDLLSCDVCNYTLNAAGECVRVSKPAASIGQTVDVVCDYLYDERRLLFRCIEGGQGTVGAVTTECSYTMYGIMKSCSTLGDAPLVSPTITCTYDGFRRLQTCTDEMGNVTECAYDNKGYVTCSVYGEEVDGPGGAGNVLLAKMRTNQPIVTKDVDNIQCAKLPRSVLKSYFETGGSLKGVRLKKVLYGDDRIAAPDGSDPFFAYQEIDEVCVVERFTPGQTTPHALETTTLHYSPAGLLLSETCNGDTLSTYAHDTAGRLTTSTQPGVCSTVCTLDACGNPTVCVVTALSTIQGAAAETFTTTRSYDPLGREVSCSDSLANVTTCDFDSRGRITRCVQPGGLVTTCDFDTLSASTGEFSSCTVTQTSPLGAVLSTSRCVCLGGFCGSETDALGHTTTHACDALGRLVLTNFPDGTSEACSFNKLGHPVRQTRKDGAITTADFNYRGRCTSTVCDNLPAGVIPVPPTVSVYNGLDQCVQLMQGTSVITRSFDSCGNELSETQDGRSVTKTFSHRGRTGIVYPTGESFSESRNAQGQLLSVSAVNAQGQILSPAISACDYSGFSCVREVRQNGVVTTYDIRSDGEPALALAGGIEDFSFGECVRCTITTAIGTVLEDCITRRNRDGCEVQNQRAFGAVSATGAPRLRRMTFTLDARNLTTGCLTQVRTAVGGQVTTESNVSYVLDARGQRVSASGGRNPGSYSSTATIPPGDAQMAQYSTWPGGALTWDPNGSLTDLSRGTGGLHLIYDAYSRLVEVQSAASVSLATYAYDACDRRTSSTIPASTVGAPPSLTSFLYDGDVCIQESDGANVPQRTYACASGGTICIVPINGDPIYPHSVASTAAMRWTPLVPKPQEPITYRMSVTNTTGNVMERVASDHAGQPIFLNELGNVRPGAASTLSGYNWVKDCYDGVCIWCPESGLFQCESGAYSPELGRATSIKIGGAEHKNDWPQK